MSFLLGLIIGAFCGASIMWWSQDREARRFDVAPWLHDANESTSAWLRRNQ